MDKEKTKVIFRKFKDGDIIAIFPKIKESEKFLMSYMHVGQHGACCPTITDTTKLATKKEYAALQKELKGLGYNLNVVKKIMR